MSRLGTLLLCVLLLSLSAPSLAASPQTGERESLIAVGPGGVESSEEIATRCPTFLWGSDAAFERVELAVYRVLDGDRRDVAPEPALRKTLDGRAPGWTPTRSECLERGAAYAWSVRRVGRSSTGAWAAPRWFRVPAAPSAEEIEEVLGALRRAASGGPTSSLDREASARGSAYRATLSEGSAPASSSAVGGGSPVRREQPGLLGSGVAFSVSGTGSLGLAGDLAFSNETDHTLGVEQRVGSGLDGRSLTVRAGDGNSSGQTNGGDLVLEAGSARNSATLGIDRGGDLVLRSGANAGTRTDVGGHVRFETGTAGNAYEVKAWIFETGRLLLASGSYLQFASDGSAPGVCNEGRRGTVYYSSAQQDLCLCNDSDSWVAIVEGGSCS